MGIPSLITSTNFNSLGNDINIVGTFSSTDSVSSAAKYSSPMLLNYVEPYDYQGVEKTLFYTEVNTNIKVGDRVFIINGNYDSNELIESDKYKKSRDGYKVIFVDFCKIALDIDYTGDLPNIGNVENGDSVSDYIKIYYVDSYDSFLSANKQLSTRNGTFNHKFDYYQNNIAFIDSDYGVIDDGWVYNEGITGSPGFYVKNPTQSNWSSITTEFINSGSYSLALAPSYNFYNNGKLKVMGKSFTYNGFEFKSGYVYVWDSINLTWKVDIKEESTFTRAIISKSNFRDGDFNGNFNSGVYGSKSKKLNWTGSGIWNGGTLLNTLWKTGAMNSKIILPVSYQANIKNNIPFQKINTYNNGGYGFNYIIESEFDSSSIYSAIIRNAKFGTTSSLPVVENHIMSYTQSFDNVVTNGLFESSEFSNVSIIGGAIKNTRSENSKLTDVKIINSFVKDSVISNSTIISDSIIKIDGYDELNNSERRNSTSDEFSSVANTLNPVDFKVYRFYIGEADFFKLRHGDSFYIKGLKIKNNINVINFFDKKFTIGNWTEYVDHYNTTSTYITPETFYKRGMECSAFLSTPEENEWIYNTTATQSTGPFYTEAIVENNNPRYSIDIFISTKDINNDNINGLNFDYATQSSLSSTLIRPNYSQKIDISDAYIIDSNIDSSYIENSDWNSGYNINYNNDLVISSFTNSSTVTNYNISINSLSQLVVETPYNPLYKEIKDNDSNNPNVSDIKIDDVIFLNSVDYYTKGKILSISIIDGGSNYSTNIDISPSYSTLSNNSDGYGLVLSNTVNSGVIDSVSIETNGLDYNVGDLLYLSYPGQGSDNGGSDATIRIDEVDTSIVRLPDTYKVVENSSGVITLSEMVTGTTSVIAGLTTSGVFRTNGAENRWNYLSRTKITGSKIKSGFFRRSYITNSLIQDSDYDVTDIDYNNMKKIKNLVLSDILFYNNDNILSSATYLNSSFIGGTDVWNNGIIQNSIINGLKFNRGIIKESSWLDGEFNGGIFYNSRSYNGNPTTDNPYYYNNRIKSYYRSGITSTTQSNDRYSWENGIFNDGEFFKSDWENGEFNGGLFINSKWYNGVAKGGQFGDDTTSTNDTIFYNGVIDYTTVNNAKFYSDDVSNLAENKSVIEWNDGIFNKGLFGSSLTENYTITPYTITEDTVLDTNSSSQELVTTINVTHSNIDIKDLNLSVNFSSSVFNLLVGSVSIPTTAPLSNLVINLKSPNGKVINIKGYGSGSSNSILNNTKFTTSTDFIKLNSGTQPYTGTFNIDNFTSQDYFFTNTNKANTTDLLELIDSVNGIDGSWEVISYLISPNNTPITYIIDFTLEFLIDDKTIISSTQNEAIWNNGTFNGGQFINDAVWKDGVFNGGKFLSSYGWTQSGSYSVSGPSSSHSWQGGIFNGGEFGNSTLESNSTWFTGEFNNGIFNGRVWNNGVFRYGEFNGSGDTAIGSQLGTYSHIIYGTSSNAQSFVNSYTQSFYGLWRNGIVTNQKDIYVKDKKFYTDIQRSNSPQVSNLSAKFNNMLWKNGIFSNPDGYIENSVWLGGIFELGYFNLSSFNPYVDRGAGVYDFNLSDTNCYWLNGELTDSEFFYSNWFDGKFISGTSSGMVFNNGTSYYMNAYNVLWQNGTWKNGNWNGSIFNYDGSITNDYQTKILNRLNSINSDNKLHIWNIFEDIPTYSVNVLTLTASSINTYISNVNPDGEDFEPPVII